MDQEDLESLFKKHGFDDFKWLNPKDIIVAQWVRMKCTFGCNEYGKNATCPPNTPSIEECERLFSEYEHAVVFHFEKKVDKPEDRHEWGKGINKRLVELERQVFLKGYRKTFLMYMDSCAICIACSGVRTECKHPRLARPGADAMGIDVFATVKKIGYEVEVLKEYTDTMNRFSILLIE